MIRLIAAIDTERGLARDNQIPWKIPADITRFRRLTLTHGAKVLVGRNTYEQMGNYFSDHETYIVSRQDLELPKEHTLVKDIDTFLKELKGDIWVIGGAGIYAASIKYADEIYLTIVEGDHNCDQFFPEYSSFKAKDIEGPLEDNGYKFIYQLLTRF